MTSLKGLVQQAHEGANLVVTHPHSQWLERLEHEQVPSLEALIHVIRSYLQQYSHPRAGRFSPSSMGECARRIVFGYAGAPQQPPDLDNQEMMDHGKGGHLKWQIEGLTMGYMKEVEHWVYDEHLQTGGSIDAVLQDDSLFELKTAGYGVYNRVVAIERTPKFENLMQLHTYFLLYDTEWASLVYENRGTGSFYEFRVARDAKYEREVLRRLRSYRNHVEADELPEQLDMCAKKMGTVFKRCPYRSICHKVDSVSAASTYAEDADEGRREPVEMQLPEWALSLLTAVKDLEERHVAEK